MYKEHKNRNPYPVVIKNIIFENIRIEHKHLIKRNAAENIRTHRNSSISDNNTYFFQLNIWRFQQLQPNIGGNHLHPACPCS